MLANSYTVNLGATPVILTKVNQDAYTSNYFAKVGTDKDVSLTIKHTFPKKRNASGIESHLVRIDVNYYNPVDQSLLRTVSQWTVWQTAGLYQVDADSASVQKFLKDFVATAGVEAAVLGRES